MMTKDMLLQEFGINEEEFRQTGAACSVSTKKKRYNNEEVSTLREARRLLHDGLAQSYEEVANHFKGLNAKLYTSEESIDIAELENEYIQNALVLGKHLGERGLLAVQVAALATLSEGLKGGIFKRAIDHAVLSLQSEGEDEILQRIQERWKTIELDAGEANSYTLEGTPDSLPNNDYQAT
jgi:hypothetical protein